MRKKGFIALTSALIISAILLAVVVSASMSALFSRYNNFDSESKKKSLWLAEACVEYTKLSLFNNPDFAGNVFVEVGDNKCEVGVVTTAGLEKTFKTRGISNQSYTTLEIVLNTEPFGIVSWKEVPDF